MTAALVSSRDARIPAHPYKAIPNQAQAIGAHGKISMIVSPGESDRVRAAWPLRIPISSVPELPQ